jgi:DNA (cytosine-5)-methyltransferase 1
MGLIVDLFAGGGGASLGIEWALGRSPDVAVNHDANAVAMHEANHPNTKHLRGDVWHYAPEDVTGGAAVEWLHASPTCTFFSKAKGAPLDRADASKVRSLAWVVVRWAKEAKPRLISVENVSEFEQWGPLKNDGKPCEKRRGLTFRRWVRALENEGYRVEWRELRSCDFGAPTTRKRLFILARCDGLPIRWPTPTHGPVASLWEKPYRTAAECIDWSVPCPSIYNRARPLSDATMRRVQRGLQRFVLDEPNPYVTRSVKQGLCRAFIAKHYGGHGTPGTSLRQPLSTITTVDHHALVTAHGDPIVDVGMRALTPRELFRAQGFPDSYRIDAVNKTAQIRCVGNSVSPQVVEALVRANASAQRARAA